MHFMILASVIVMALGFVALHFALTHRTAELKVAGWTLVIGGLAVVVMAVSVPPPRPIQMMPSYGRMLQGGEGMMGKQCHHGEPKGEKPEGAAK